MPAPNPATALQAAQGATGAAQSDDMMASMVSSAMTSKYQASHAPPPVQAPPQEPVIQSPQDVVQPQPPADAKQHQAAQSAAAQPGGFTMMPVSSSTLKLIGYDPQAGELHCLFKSGPETYVYSGVPAKTFTGLLNAKSKGLFHANEVKGKYKFSKKRPIPPQL